MNPTIELIQRELSSFSNLKNVKILKRPETISMEYLDNKQLKIEPQYGVSKHDYVDEGLKHELYTL
jgi:hypothetical protein